MSSRYIQVYTGSGKGKTTAALGLAMRVVGGGKKVCMIQFMKGQKSGEIETIDKIPDFEVYQFGRKEFVDKNKPSTIDIQLAEQGLKKAEEVINSGRYDLVILDEIIVAINFQLLKLDKVMNVIKSGKNIDIVLTGRDTPEEIIDVADLVTEMKEIKHPYKEDKKSRRGIDY
ncbi:MAG: cob(I)yrinic acid a,c-diamide adenosyltransferase [Candidatus Thermoplasmatota archaeon]